MVYVSFAWESILLFVNNVVVLKCACCNSDIQTIKAGRISNFLWLRRKMASRMCMSSIFFSCEIIQCALHQFLIAWGVRASIFCTRSENSSTSVSDNGDMIVNTNMGFRNIFIFGNRDREDAFQSPPSLCTSANIKSDDDSRRKRSFV